MKEEMNSLDVAAVTWEFNTGATSLIDAKIGKIYQSDNDEIRLTLSIIGKGRHYLVIQAGKRIHLTRYPRPAPKLPLSFPMLLRKHLQGGRIKRISQHDFDRIIELEVIRGGVINKVVAEFFARGNIILTDADGRILQPMQPVSYKDRKLRRGEIYELPPPQISPFEVTPSNLKDILKDSNSDVVRTLATRLNLGGVLAEEICLRAGIDKHTPADMVTDFENLQKSITELFSPISEGRLEPQVVTKKGENIDVLPSGLEQYRNLEIQKFDSFNAALDEFFSKKGEIGPQEEIKSEKKENVLERRLRQQREAIEKFNQQASQLKAKGELLYANYQEIEQILNNLTEARKSFSWDEIRNRLKAANTRQARTIRSIDPESGTLTLILGEKPVEVNIKLTLHQNAQAYYDRAKKITNKKAGAERAIQKTMELIDKNAEPERSSRRSMKVKVKPRWYDRFRWFESSDGFMVVGGRDAGTNEEIVKKYAEKRDIFFHTELPGSPAVIIKTEGKEVPQTTLDEAAKFVVSNSAVWKSGIVEGECYWVTTEQVSKTPESGEFLPHGSFVIRGKRNYMKVNVGAAIGIQTEGALRLIGGPPGAVRKLAKYEVEVEPGEFSQNDIARKIYKMLVDKLGDRVLVKSIASPDKIAMMLPAGTSKVKS